ncbi:type VI immunity family protein [Pantoea sp. MBD-2R]|uniref:type VI immunity family protein n=1 Tax=Pantoea sp. MBD-2R TaxID=3141540 RepID=UPI0031833821
MQMTAAGNVAINAGGDISIGSMGNTSILAGDKIGLFAHTGKLSLNASEGPVQIQAQNGEIPLSAEQKLSLISASDMLFAGKKKVTFVLPYARERMFPYEYALAQRFPGVMVDSLGTLEGGEAVEGVKGACWYTILGNPWLEKLAHRLKKTPEIELLPYNSGLIMKADALPPALGETKTEELPPLLLKVNQMIKPIRQDGHNGLHFYSGHENFQFEEASSMAWFARFDEASAELEKEDDGKSFEPERITRWDGDLAPYAGRWATIVNGTTQYLQTREGQVLPEFEDRHGKKFRACWSLLERDDKGSVFFIPD